MDDDGGIVIDPHVARDALARTARADAAGRLAGRRAIRRHFLGTGVGFAGWLLVDGAVHRWVGGGSWVRALVDGLFVGLLFGLVAQAMAREPVRARLSLGRRIAVVAGGVVVFALLMGLSWDYPVAYPLGVVAIVGYWAGAAWWLTRAP